MAHWARDFTLGGAGAQWPVAAAFAGGVAAVLLELVDLQPTVVKLDEDGAVTWQRKYTLPSSNTVQTGFGIAANADGSRIALAVDESGGSTTVYMLDGADGDILWETSLPMRLQWYYAPSGGKHFSGRIALASDDDVVLVGLSSAGASHRLVRLSSTDGTVVWHVDILDRTSLSSSTEEPRQIAINSNDDIIVATIGKATVPVVYKFDGTDGSTLWSREITGFTSGFIDYLACVDPSDNVYIAGKKSSGLAISVVKLNSSGADVWDADLALDTTPSTLVVNGKLAADDDALYIPVYVDPNGSTPIGAAIITLNAAGSAATCVYYDPAVSNNVGATFGTGGLSVVDGSLYLAAHQYFHDTFYYDSTIYRRELPGLGVGDYDPSAEYVATELDVTVSAGTAAAASFTPDFDAPATLTPAGSTSSAGSITYTTALYELESLAPGAAVWSAAGSGSAAFRWGYDYHASGAAPATNYGTPTLFRFHSVDAAAPTTRYGVPSLLLSPAGDEVYQVDQDGPATRYGTPTLELDITLDATGAAPSTQYGTPRLERRMPATGAAPSTQYGTPKLELGFRATGVRSTNYGTPSLDNADHVATGRAPQTRYGTPRLVMAGAGYHATGAAPGTQYGTPTMAFAHRARGMGPSTRYGIPTLEQSVV